MKYKSPAPELTAVYEWLPQFDNPRLRAVFLVSPRKRERLFDISAEIQWLNDRGYWVSGYWIRTGIPAGKTELLQSELFRLSIKLNSWVEGKAEEDILKWVRYHAEVEASRHLA